MSGASVRYITVFDASKFESFLNLALAVPGILMIVAAVYVLRNHKRSADSRQDMPLPFVRWLFLPFVVTITAVAIVVLAGNAARAAYWVITKQCTVIEGPVQNFHPEPVPGHGYESFTVEGVPFKYSGPIVTAGFHFPGLVHPGLPVRLCYREGEILRLEVAQGQ